MKIGRMTLSITTLSIMTLCIIVFSIMTHNIVKLGGKLYRAHSIALQADIGNYFDTHAPSHTGQKNGEKVKTF
jgi:hypothetical protein